MSDSGSDNAWRQPVAALADTERLRLFARIVVAEVVEGSLSRDDRRRLAPLVTAGLVVRDGGALRADPDLFAALLTQKPRPSSGPERFLVNGRLTSLPRRQSDRDEMLQFLAARALPLLEPVSEPALMRRLRELADDPVGVRRALVDAGIVTRARDGSEYWRTHVTSFDVDPA